MPFPQTAVPLRSPLFLSLRRESLGQFELNTDNLYSSSDLQYVGNLANTQVSVSSGYVTLAP